MSMAPQAKFNMPKMGGGLTPMKGSMGGGTGNLNPGGAAMPRGPGSGGGMSLPTPRPPSTMQPGMGGGLSATTPSVGTRPMGGGLRARMR